jgi:DNA-binding transcriptional LysR family regulator
MPASSLNVAGWLRSRLKLRHLQLLVAVDDERSIHKAAAALSMTQPAATKLLADLEGLVGRRLFERTTRGVVATAYGDSLVRHARAVLGTFDHAQAELVAIDAGATGRIAMGVLLVVAPVLVPRALARFKLAHPRITVHVQEGTLGSLLPELRRGRIDVVVGRLTADFESTGLRFETCYDEPMEVVVRAGHPLLARKRLALADLVDEAWILHPPDSAYRHRMDAAFRQHGVEPPANVVESLSILTNQALLQASDMLGVMPRNVARHFAAMQSLCILSLALPSPSGPVGIVTRSGAAPSPSAQALLTALREVSREMTAG